jgi:hypothetical protein
MKNQHTLKKIKDRKVKWVLPGGGGKVNGEGTRGQIW